MSKKNKVILSILALTILIAIISINLAKSYKKRIKNYIAETIAQTQINPNYKVLNIEDNVAETIVQKQNSSDNKIKVLELLGDYLYARHDPVLRKNHFEFNNIIKELDNNTLSTKRKNYIEKVCLFETEESVSKISIAKAYNCLAILQALKSQKVETYRAIKNSSYSLDLLYKPEFSQNLANIITKEHKSKILSSYPELKEKDLSKYFSGYSKDEIPFLNKLIALNIPELSAKAYYRIYMIYLLGHSSELEKEIKYDFKEAVIMLNRSIELSQIVAKNIVNIALIINDKYAVHAATTIASALLNADLDSVYNFYIVTDPEHPVTLESQKKLSSMQNIRRYNVNFVQVNDNSIPLELVKNRFKNISWPFLIAYRPFLYSIFPHLNKVLSLDVDLLVLRDLNYFNNIDMSDYFIAGVFDAGNPWHSEDGCLKTPPYIYINAGVMWFDLQNMRDNNAHEDLIASLQNTTCQLGLFEQDLLNSVFYNRIHHISHKWNHTPAYVHSTTNINYHTKFILHYSGPKPWDAQKDQLTDLQKEYWRYRELTPWRDDIVN